LIYPGYMTGYWVKTLMGSIVPRFTDFRVKGGNRWLGFYLGLLRGKIRRNKWVLAAVVLIVGSVIGERRLGELSSQFMEMTLWRCKEWLVRLWGG
jgi:hypothetical protein